MIGQWTVEEAEAFAATRAQCPVCDVTDSSETHLIGCPIGLHLGKASRKYEGADDQAPFLPGHERAIETVWAQRRQEAQR